jgi:hypothetical protein
VSAVGLVTGKRATVSKLTRRQLAWIEARDAVGEAIDRCLKTAPPTELSAVVEAVEDSPRDGDQAVGLL